MSKERLSATINKETLNQFKKVCDKNDFIVSQIIELLIEMFIKMDSEGKL